MNDIEHIHQHLAALRLRIETLEARLKEPVVGAGVQDKEVLQEMLQRHELSEGQFFCRKGSRTVTQARVEIIRALHHQRGWSLARIAAATGLSANGVVRRAVQRDPAGEGDRERGRH
jgi:hypothetical protein